jgi:hypothetical protein
VANVDGAAQALMDLGAAIRRTDATSGEILNFTQILK